MEGGVAEGSAGQQPADPGPGGRVQGRRCPQRVLGASRVLETPAAGARGGVRSEEDVAGAGVLSWPGGQLKRGTSTAVTAQLRFPRHLRHWPRVKQEKSWDLTVFHMKTATLILMITSNVSTAERVGVLRFK